jgi:hypothetical protein
VANQSSCCKAFRVAEGELSRTPRKEVRQELRREVGFGCPVEGCGSPYLTYHHFDPPWAVEHHQDPARMIALCREHHDKAAALTVEQCRALKRVDPDRVSVRGKFLWMREQIVAIVGGNYFFNVRCFVSYNWQPVVWVNRDDEGRLLLNFIPIVADASEPHTHMEDNDWIIEGSPEDVECPPSGRLLKVRYPGGDTMSIEFREHSDFAKLITRYPRMKYSGWHLEFPLLTVEVTLAVGGTDYALASDGCTFPGQTIRENFLSDRQWGFDVGDPRWLWPAIRFGPPPQE